MKKRALAILFAFVLVVSLFPTVAALASSTMYVSTSNGKALNMRDYPSKDGNVITTIPYGAKVSMDEGFVGSSWVMVTYKGNEGYCMARYLSTSKPGPKPTQTTTATPTESSSLYDYFVSANYTVSVRPSSPGGFVHLRWAPSKNQPIQRDYYNGEELTVISQNGTWCQVYDQSNNVCGFMMSSFLVSVN
jgi:uncharacterized protein YraI